MKMFWYLKYFVIIQHNVNCLFVDVPADGIMPGVHDLCASYLLVITRHLCHRVERAMMFVEQSQLIPPDKQTLVR